MKRKLPAVWLSAAMVLLLALTWFASAAEPRSANVSSNPASNAAGVDPLVAELEEATEGAVRVSYHAYTGKVRFIGTDPLRPIPRPEGLAPDAEPETAALSFLDRYGSLFGLTNPAEELSVMVSEAADRGRAFVRFQQVYRGVPVLGGELIVQVNRDGEVVSASGEVLPSLQTDVVPAVGAEQAQEQALALVSKTYDVSPDALTATVPELWLYNPALLGASGPQVTSLVWRMDLTPSQLLPIRELVLVDARFGFVALHFNQVDTAKNRQTYDAQSGFTLPGLLRRSEGQGAIGDSDVDKAHDFAGDTYDFYATYHGRDSIDGHGMAIVSSVRYCPQDGDCPYANAFWNGQQMVYGQGYAAADDVVGHELTHGVTTHESHLFYYMQSGAINEAFSDIWGEFVDQINGAGNDSPGVLWLLGEDLPGGAARSLSNPPAYDDPDKMSSSKYYCGEQDQGGVHTNSGVANKAAYLMTAGGSFNGKTVSGLGTTKVVKILYEVQSHMFTSASDYEDLYDNTRQACADLVGTSGITTADCQQVKNALDAVEMNQQPSGCAAVEAPYCPSGTDYTLVYKDDMESPAAGKWASAAITGDNTWYYPQTANPYDYDATYAVSGIYNLWGYNQPKTADFYIAMTSNVAVPTSGTPYLHFHHAYAFEDWYSDLYDGGVLEYSTNSGGSWIDAGSLFTDNGYTGTIHSGNPLAGRQAFTGESNGYMSSRLNLSSLAGQNVRFRFRIGTDSGNDALGWFIDDLRLYTCSAAASATPTRTATATRTPTPTPTQEGGGRTFLKCDADVASTVFTTDESCVRLRIYRSSFPNLKSVTWYNHLGNPSNPCPNTPGGCTVITYNYSGGVLSSWDFYYYIAGQDRVPGGYSAKAVDQSNAHLFTDPFQIIASDSTATPTPTATRQTGDSTVVYLPIVFRQWPAAPRPTATPTATATRTPAATPTPTATEQAACTTILNETFEGTFPGVWQVSDKRSGYGEYYWGKRDCNAFEGTYGGWAVGGGASGSILSCGSNYPNYARSWMVYGPFSLADAASAELTFKIWLDTEEGFDYLIDYLFWGASTDGSTYYGLAGDGDTEGWDDAVLDMGDVYQLGDLTGEPNVWIALVFQSDESFNYPGGAFVDNLVLQKCTTAQGAAGGSAVLASNFRTRPATMTLPR